MRQTFRSEAMVPLRLILVDTTFWSLIRTLSALISLWRIPIACNALISSRSYLMTLRIESSSSLTLPLQYLRRDPSSAYSRTRWYVTTRLIIDYYIYEGIMLSLALFTDSWVLRRPLSLTMWGEFLSIFREWSSYLRTNSYSNASICSFFPSIT